MTRAVLATLGLVGVVVVGVVLAQSDIFQYLTTSSPPGVESIDQARSSAAGCNGASCEMAFTWWSPVPGLNATNQNNTLYGLMSLFTNVQDPAGCVAPGSSTGVVTASEGEVIGYGVHIYDTPPVTFSADGKIVAQTANLAAFSRKRASSSFTQTTLSVPEPRDAKSTWSDTWKAYIDDGTGALNRETSLVTCSTDNGFTATCLVHSSLSADKVRVELHRQFGPWDWGSTGTIITSFGLDQQATAQYQLAAKNRPPSGEMVASTVLNICGNGGSPTPSVSGSPTPTPTVSPTPTPTGPPEVEIECKDGDGNDCEDTEITHEETITITWSVDTSAVCVASGDWTGQLSTTGQFQQHTRTRGTQTFTITCENSFGTTTKTVSFDIICECNDGIDNTDPEDVLVDAADPGCHTDGNATDGDDTYNPYDNSERDGVVIDPGNLDRQD